MAHALAGGYHGPPELTAVRALTEWTLDAWMLALVLLLGGCYLAGLRHLRRQGQPWSRWRTVNFVGLGLGIVVIATMSSFGTYSGSCSTCGRSRPSCCSCWRRCSWPSGGR